MIRLPRTLCALTLLLCLSSCLTSGEPEPRWTEATIQAPTEQVLWDASLLSLQKQDYPLGAVVDRASGQLVSGWKTSLAAFRGQGWRAKAWIQFKRQELGRYDLKVRVQRETNQDIVRPLDPSYAKWESAEDDESAARILMQMVRSYLSPELPLEEESTPPKASRR